MSPRDIAEYAVAGVTVGGAIIAFLAFAIKSWISAQLHDLKELRPNGGGSSYDLIRTQAKLFEELILRVSNIEQFIVKLNAPEKKPSKPRVRVIK